MIPVALGPGADDPRSPRKVGPETARGPLGPGDRSAANADEAFEFLAMPALGPGDIASVRSLTRIPKRGAAVGGKE